MCWKITKFTTPHSSTDFDTGHEMIYMMNGVISSNNSFCVVIMFISVSFIVFTPYTKPLGYLPSHNGRWTSTG